MLFRPFASLAVASTLFTSSSAQLLNLDLSGLLGLNLDIGLLQNGALVNINAFADVLTSTSESSLRPGWLDGVSELGADSTLHLHVACATGQTIGINANLLGILRVCACVSALNLVTQRVSSCWGTAREMGYVLTRYPPQPNPNACPAVSLIA